MNPSKLKLGLLAASVVPFLMACPKAKQVAPEPDTEVQSSADVSHANMIITDIDMICSFMGVNDMSPDFYLAIPGQAPNALQSINDPADYSSNTVFVNAKCLDAKLREGGVMLEYPNTNPNALYYQNYGFKGNVRLSEFKVDGWLVKKDLNIPFTITNNLKSANFNPATTNLSWTIEGRLEFYHPTDPSKNMTWQGKLIKTLANTKDPEVFDPSRPIAINWALAKVEYYGEATGVTSANVPFKMAINSAKPLTRDFTCSSDVIGGVTSVQPLKTWKNEFHPFKSGIVSFTTGDKYPRQIYYGNEGNPDLPNQCDNSGQVLIKGNSYVVNF